MDIVVIDQDNEGRWLATRTDGEVSTVDGWAGLRALVESERAGWRTPADLSRFRAEYGEPPSDLPADRLTIAPVD